MSSELTRALTDITECYLTGIRSGLDIGAHPYRAALEGVVKAWKLAEDQGRSIPTPLLAACVNAERVLKGNKS